MTAEQPEGEGEDKALGYSLDDLHMRLAFAFHAQRRCLRRTGKALGLGSGQPRLLVYLAVHGPCNQRKLAVYFEVDPAAVCRMLDALERAGFVRAVSSKDRRARIVAITQRGLDAVAEWDRACASVDEAMLVGFTASEREQFESLLRRAHENLRDEALRQAEEDKAGDAAPLVAGAPAAPVPPAAETPAAETPAAETSAAETPAANVSLAEDAEAPKQRAAEGEAHHG